MPTYEYECQVCGNSFELFQSITEPPKKKCPACGRLKARRLIGRGSALIFKGSGFYQTDHRSPEYKRQAKEESGLSGSGKSSGEEKPKTKDKEESGLSGSGKSSGEERPKSKDK